VEDYRCLTGHAVFDEGNNSLLNYTCLEPGQRMSRRRSTCRDGQSYKTREETYVDMHEPRVGSVCTTPLQVRSQERKQSRRLGRILQMVLVGTSQRWCADRRGSGIIPPSSYLADQICTYKALVWLVMGIRGWLKTRRCSGQTE
jgi:hypothetical protein